MCGYFDVGISEVIGENGSLTISQNGPPHLSTRDGDRFSISKERQMANEFSELFIRSSLHDVLCRTLSAPLFSLCGDSIEETLLRHPGLVGYCRVDLRLLISTTWHIENKTRSLRMVACSFSIKCG